MLYALYYFEVMLGCHVQIQVIMGFFGNSSGMEAAAVTQTLFVEPEREVVLVFPSNTTVFNVEDLLEERELNFELIPVPKEINPNCGLAISFSYRDRPEIMRTLNRAGYQPSAAYVRAGDHFVPWGGHRPYLTTSGGSS